jgi:DNA-binding CsgD family transcriptional regulator
LTLRVLFYAGEPERAVEKLIEVTRLDPALLSAHLWLALALSESGRFEEAIVTASESLNLDKNPVTRCCLSYVLARAGCREEAAGILSSLLPPFTNRYVSPVWLASIYTALDMQNEAAKQLESASNENSYALIWRKIDPRLKGRARARALSRAQTISPAVARRVSGLLSSMLPPKQTAYDLTPHETRLLNLLMEGHNYKTAATVLGVSFNTIAFHMKNVYQKLQVHSKSEAVAKASRGKIIG